MTKNKKIYFGAGCFWCVESSFSNLKGVISVGSGYMGGTGINPDYKSVCSGATGHAEVVEVSYDSDIISIYDLLKFFFLIHDPTQINRQGPDIGTQYRSAIFYTDSDQEKIAQTYKAEVAKKIKAKVATEISKAGKFYKAEDYHQNYYQKHGKKSYFPKGFPQK